MGSRARAIVVAALAAALVVFAVVQDRLTAAGARAYVRMQRSALEGRGAPVTLDEVMEPAISRSVRQGLLWGGVVLLAGLGAASMSKRGRRE
jgi:hypothetical protein